MDQNNPLKHYFRQIKTYISLPSGTSRYPEGTIKFTDNGEVGIYPMTGKDELILKNPDALLNGEAVVEVIRSCVPAVQNPTVLLANDIDALITAIRHATYNDKLEVDVRCPECNHENHFRMDLQYALSNMSYLEPEYSVTLETGLRVIVKPYSYKEMLQSLQARFEQGKVARAVDDDQLSDDQRLRILGTAFKKMSTTTFDMLSASIVAIVDQSSDLRVTDAKFIKEFLMNIEKKNIDLIKVLVDEINLIGVKKDFHAVCEKCNHEWENEIDFNPVNFS